MSWYGLASYREESLIKPALVLKDELFDLANLYRAVHPGSETQPLWVSSVENIIASWEECATELESLANVVSASSIAPVSGGPAKLAAPFKPTRIFGTASNYTEHANEMETVLAAKEDSSPYIFMKATSSVIGPDETVLLPPETEKADWEVELGVVIGKGGRRISAENAIDHIAGYTVVNDISARDMNRRTDYPFKHDWFRGKSWDTFCPLGPWIVPKECIDDLHNLGLQLTLNGEVMQNGNTSELIWNVFEQIAYLSSLLTLQPGDTIMTGTPAGVGMGRGHFLKPGDVMVASVNGVGSIKNPVAAE